MSQKEPVFFYLAKFELLLVACPTPMLNVRGCSAKLIFSEQSKEKKKKEKKHTVDGTLLSAGYIKFSRGSCVQVNPSKDMFNRIAKHVQLFQSFTDEGF